MWCGAGMHYVGCACVSVYGVVNVCVWWVVCVPSQRAAFEVNRLNAMAEVHYNTPASGDAKCLRVSLSFSLPPCLMFWFHALASLLSHQFSYLSPRTLFRVKFKFANNLLLSL